MRSWLRRGTRSGALFLIASRRPEADRPLRGYRGRLKQFPQDPEHILQLNVVLAYSAFDSVDLPGKILMRGEHPPKVDESTNHLNAGADRDGAAERIC